MASRRFGQRSFSTTTTTPRRRKASFSPAGDSEHDVQSRFFAYLSHINHPAVRCTFAIPNGFLRTKAMRLRAWKEGVRAGVSDTFTAFPVPPFCGLWMELKVKGNTLSPEQRWWLEEMRRVGYRAEVVGSAEEMLQTWADYLGFEVSVTR